MARLGFPAIRGSSTKAWDKAKPKGGAGAFREVLRWLSRGGGVAITPDGPRGPSERMAEGAPLLAKMSGAPVLLVGLACRPALRLGTWDRAILPIPFGRGVVVWAGPFEIAGDADRGAVEAARVDQLTTMITGVLIVGFLIVEPHGLARLWQTVKQKLRVWPFPY